MHSLLKVKLPEYQLDWVKIVFHFLDQPLVLRSTFLSLKKCFNFIVIVEKVWGKDRPKVD